MAAGLIGLAASAAAADAPGRVVSMNLCTDQLAILLAAPGQLVSVSDIARDPLMSPLHAAAAGLPVNHGSAEEIYLLDPDLVLAGPYSDPATVSMLRRLGIRVEQVAVVGRLDEVAPRVTEMGRLLGREAEAARIVAEFEADLARLVVPPHGPRAAFYYPNGYSPGIGTLSHEILTAAGFRHIAAEIGRGTAARLPLEMLVLSAPDMVIRSETYPGASRSEEILTHPALQAVVAEGRGHVSGADWVCGTPHVVEALAGLAVARAEIEAAR